MSFLSYPYPVLTNPDLDIQVDVGGKFQIRFEFQEGYCHDNRNHIFAIEVELQNKTIEEMLSDGRADFVVEVYSRQSLYHNFFKLPYQKTGQYLLDIDSNILFGKFTIKWWIINNQSLSNYKPDQTHPDFCDSSIDVPKQSVIAYGGESSWKADSGFNPSEARTSSIIKIRMDKHINFGQPAHISYEKDYIEVRLAKQDYENYETINNYSQLNYLKFCQLVFLPLIRALHLIQQEEASETHSDHSHKMWYRRLIKICKTKGYDLEDPATTAQELLNNPIAQSLEATVNLKKRKHE